MDRACRIGLRSRELGKVFFCFLTGGQTSK